MGDLTEHFSIWEFHCHDGTPYPIEWISDRLVPLSNQAEIIRAINKKPLTIISGYRTPSYNARLKGSGSKSQHLYGRAIDIKLKGFSQLWLYRTLKQMIKDGKLKQGGLGLYYGHVHYDIRGKRARWNRTHWKP